MNNRNNINNNNQNNIYNSIQFKYNNYTPNNISINNIMHFIAQKISTSN